MASMGPYFGVRPHGPDDIGQTDTVLSSQIVQSTMRPGKWLRKFRTGLSHPVLEVCGPKRGDL